MTADIPLSGPLDVLALMHWGLLAATVVCTIAVVYVGARTIFSKVVCDTHERESKNILGALVVAIVIGIANTVLNLTGSG